MSGQQRTLQELRDATGLTVEQVARKLVMTTARVTAWERGALCPTPTQVGRLARVLGVREGMVRMAVAEGEREGSF